MRVDQLDGVSVVRVDPECDLIGLRQRCRIERREPFKVRRELRRSRKGVVVDHPVADVRVQQRVERAMVEFRLRGCWRRDHGQSAESEREYDERTGSVTTKGAHESGCLRGSRLKAGATKGSW